MSDSDSLPPSLERVQSFLDEEKTDAALRELNRVIDNQPTLTAHQLRLKLVVPNLSAPDLIAESLKGINQHDAEVYQEAFQRVEEALHERLEGLRSEIADCRRRRCAKPHLQELDTLTALGTLYPIIHFARAVGYKEAAQLEPNKYSDEAGRSPFRNLSDIFDTHDHMRRRHSRDVVPVVKDDEYAGWMETATEALRTAARLMPHSSPHYGEIHELLGSIYEDDGQPFQALEAYRTALEYGRPVEQIIQQMKERIARRVQERLLTKIDIHLLQRELDDADRLLQTHAPHPLTNSWRLRMAECAMLRGDTDSAQVLYQCLIDDEQNEQGSE